jgi:hypothetical protein
MLLYMIVIISHSLIKLILLRQVLMEQIRYGFPWC